jgi:hypothetical protein
MLASRESSPLLHFLKTIYFEVLEIVSQTRSPNRQLEKIAIENMSNAFSLAVLGVSHK